MCYSVAGPTLNFQDSHRTLAFSGNQIRVVDVPDIGTLVSITLILTVDAGSTSFTLVLPRVNLPAPPALPAMVPITAEGLTTIHHLSLAPGLQHGQQDFYSVTTLHGTAV